MNEMNSNHPELREGERFLTNSQPEHLRFIGYKSKRAGVLAYNVLGERVHELVPVFVSKAEYDELQMGYRIEW